jgi:hypothetical protein
MLIIILILVLAIQKEKLQNTLYNSRSCSKVHSPTASHSGGQGFKYWPRDHPTKGFLCSFWGHKAINCWDRTWPQPLTTSLHINHHMRPQKNPTDQQPPRHALAVMSPSLFSVLLYIYLHLGSSQSVHINICTDNNMISSSRYKCSQLFHTCWRAIQQPT